MNLNRNLDQFSHFTISDRKLDLQSETQDKEKQHENKNTNMFPLHIVCRTQ